MGSGAAAGAGAAAGTGAGAGATFGGGMAGGMGASNSFTGGASSGAIAGSSGTSIGSSDESKKKKSAAMTPVGHSPSYVQSYQDYGFTPQQGMMSVGASPFASQTNSALWGDDNDRAAVEQFLEWQKRMGY